MVLAMFRDLWTAHNIDNCRMSLKPGGLLSPLAPPDGVSFSISFCQVLIVSYFRDTIHTCHRSQV